jgi:hypothetical protein
MRRSAISLVEMLIASLVLATLGLAIYENLIQTTRGVNTDRLTEAKRHIVLDLLERFSQTYTDLPHLFQDEKKPFRKKLTVDQAFEVLGIKDPEAKTLRDILTAGKVEGFTVSWTPRQASGRGNKAAALRLDALWVQAAVAGDSPGMRVESFRLSYARGQVGE